MPSKKILMDSVTSGQPYVTHPVRDVLLPNVQSTSYTPVLADQGRVIEFTGAALQAFTIPTDTAVPFPIGTVINVCRAGAGGVYFSYDFSMTVTSSVGNGSSVTLRAQWSEATLRKRAANAWVVSGDIIFE